MKPINSKLFTTKATIQEAVNTSDNFGGYDSFFNAVGNIFGYSYSKKVRTIDSIGQWIYTEEKRFICRAFEFKQGQRIVIGLKIYRVVDWEINQKGTQYDLKLEFVGYEMPPDVQTILVINGQALIINNDNALVL